MADKILTINSIAGWVWTAFRRADMQILLALNLRSQVVTLFSQNLTLKGCTTMKQRAGHSFLNPETNQIMGSGAH